MNTLKFFGSASAGRPPRSAAEVAEARLRRPRVLPPADWEMPAVESAQRVAFRFGLSGLRWGQDGPVVLMLHGWEGRPTQFARLLGPLVASGRQVIALDAPAHGDSPGRETTLMEFALALEEAAVELRELEAVVGHSMGAAAVAVALANGLPAERAVLIAAPASIERQVGGVARQLGLSARVQQQLLRRLESANGVPVREFEIEQRVRGLSVPALLVHDRADAAVPFTEGERLARAWPGAELLATDGLGHQRVLTNPGVVARVSRFLGARASH